MKLCRESSIIHNTSHQNSELMHWKSKVNKCMVKLT